MDKHINRENGSRILAVVDVHLFSTLNKSTRFYSQAITIWLPHRKNAFLSLFSFFYFGTARSLWLFILAFPFPHFSHLAIPCTFYFLFPFLICHFASLFRFQSVCVSNFHFLQHKYCLLTFIACFFCCCCCHFEILFRFFFLSSH